MKQALIIGASGGIGGAVAEALSAQGGYALTLVGRNLSGLQAVAADLAPTDLIPTDVASELEVEALFEGLPPLDLIIYAAGDVQPEPLAKMSMGTWGRVMDANLTGLFYTLKYADAHLADGARIFAMGARPELVHMRGFGAYAAAKAGVASLLKVAAQEYRRKASVTNVLPIAVDTPFWDNVGKVPKNALEPRDVAEAILNALDAEPQAELLVG